MLTLRQVSSRNQRGKGGLKMKNALQVFLVIAICIWLIYQMAHAHGKKRIFEEGSSKALFKGGDKFSRKDLSQMNKVEAIREIQSGESRGEAREEEEEQEEAGNEEHEAAYKGGENEEASQSARERSFKADDASSAVAHVIQSKQTETESGNEAIWKNLDENAGGNDSNIVHQGISTVESKSIPVSSTMINQTAAGELPVNSTVSVEQAESPANLTVKVDPNNVTISQHQTKILNQEGEVPNLKTKRAMEQKDSETSSATNEIDKANIDALSSLDIQSKAQSSKPEAMAA